MKLRALPDFSPLRVFFFTIALGGAAGVDFVASSMMGIAGTHIRGGVHASPEDFLWSIQVAWVDWSGPQDFPVTVSGPEADHAQIAPPSAGHGWLTWSARVGGKSGGVSKAPS